MARQKAFDRQVALEKAMKTFWQYGYEGTSIQTLLQAMGINRGSLYDTFKDKRSLFLEAITHYEATVIEAAIQQLEAPGASKSAIIEYFQNLVNFIASDQNRWGCFTTNIAVELCNHDKQAASQIKHSLSRIQQAFLHALKNAQEQKEIDANANIEAISYFLICTLQGLRVMDKVNPDRQVLEQIVKTTLLVLAESD